MLRLLPSAVLLFCFAAQPVLAASLEELAAQDVAQEIQRLHQEKIDTRAREEQKKLEDQARAEQERVRKEEEQKTREEHQKIVDTKTKVVREYLRKFDKDINNALDAVARVLEAKKLKVYSLYSAGLFQEIRDLVLDNNLDLETKKSSLKNIAQKANRLVEEAKALPKKPLTELYDETWPNQSQVDLHPSVISTVTKFLKYQNQFSAGGVTLGVGLMFGCTGGAGLGRLRTALGREYMVIVFMGDGPAVALVNVGGFSISGEHEKIFSGFTEGSAGNMIVGGGMLKNKKVKMIQGKIGVMSISGPDNTTYRLKKIPSGVRDYHTLRQNLELRAEDLYDKFY